MVLAAVALAWGFACVHLALLPRFLDPGDIAWLLSDDAANVFLGWHFYRGEAWRLPPGAATDFGQVLGSSIVYSDSLPLVAMPLKLVASWLPAHFQFVGLWMLACIALQVVFAALLAREVVRTPLQRAAFVVLFAASPIMLQRSLGHFSLMAHWLLLAGFWLAIAPATRRRGLAWCALLAAAALVQAYLLYMLLALWAATLVRRAAIDRDRGPLATAAEMLAVAATLLAAFWSAGYFELPNEALTAHADIYGRYATDLNAFFNPVWGRHLLPNRPVNVVAAYEGYAYLGAGILALLLLALACWMRRRPAGWRRHVPLAVAALLLWAVALSNTVRFDDRVVLAFTLPEAVRGYGALVRSSGRFAWVLHYGLALAAAAVVVRCLPRRAATAALCIAAVLQATDVEPRLRGLREHFAARPDPAPLLRDPFWEEAARRYRHIVAVPVRPRVPGWEQLGLYAADHRMTINTGNFARVPVAAMAEADTRAKAQLASGRLAPDTLYIAWTGRGEAPYEVRVDTGTLDATIDGLRVLAPGWNAPAHPPLKAP